MPTVYQTHRVKVKLKNVAKHCEMILEPINTENQTCAPLSLLLKSTTIIKHRIVTKHLVNRWRKHYVSHLCTNKRIFLLELLSNNIITTTIKGVIMFMVFTIFHKAVSVTKEYKLSLGL